MEEELGAGLPGIDCSLNLFRLPLLPEIKEMVNLLGNSNFCHVTKKMHHLCDAFPSWFLND